MSAEPMPQDPVPSSHNLRPKPARAVRLWPAAVPLAVFWGSRLTVGHLDAPYFFRFLFALGSSTLLTLSLLAWWWTNRGIPWRGRLWGCLLVVGGSLIAEPCWDKSLGWFGLGIMGLPIVLTTCTLWMMVAKWRWASCSRTGSVLVAATTLACLGLIRSEGLDGDLRADVHWRWTASAEDKFLAEQADPPASSGDASVPLLRAGDWGEFRGPGREGVVRGQKIGTDWAKTPPRLIWRQRVGPAWSSMIVVDGRLFTQEQRGEQEAVVCYEARSGRCLWTHEDAARFWESVSGAGPRATPTFCDGRIYALGGTGLLNCLDAATGQPYWTRHIAADAAAQVPQWGFSGSPLLVEGLVIVFAGGEQGRSLLAYRAATGEPAWAAAVGSTSYSSPHLATLAGQRQCLMLTDDGLSAVEPLAGKLLWKAGLAWRGAPRSVQPHVIGPTQLLIGTLEGFGISLLEAGTEGGAWNVAETWASKELKPEFPDLVVHQGHAYGFDVNIFCCLDLSTGKRCWKAGRYGRGQVLLLAEQSLLLVGAETGEVVLLAANPQRHEELGRFAALDGKTWSHPVVVQHALYVRNAEEMACYELPPYSLRE
jgi:outer membrane protein assembly factor BamB